MTRPVNRFSGQEFYTILQHSAFEEGVDAGFVPEQKVWFHEYRRAE